MLAADFAEVIGIAWIGDCRGFTWDGDTLTQVTTHHTLGQQLRENSAPWEVAQEHDNW